MATNVARGAAGEDEWSPLESVRACAAHSPHGIALVDASTLTIAYANPPFMHAAALAAADVIESKLTDAFPASAGQQLAGLARHAVSTGQALPEIEIHQCNAAGNELILGATWWPAALDWSADFLVLQLRDASQAARERRRRHELIEELRTINDRLLIASLRELELGEKAKVASEAKSAFLATVSHELRTPLNAIIGYEHLLSDGVVGPISSGQRVHLSHIRTSAAHLLGIIDEILAVARLDAGHMTVKRQRIETNGMIGDVCDIMLPLARGKGLSLSATSDDSHVLNTDVLKLRQILINLVNNAVKFTDQGDISIRVHDEAGVLHFDVSDTGIGIAPTHFETIFDPFWQVDQSNTRRAQGTGLGLCVSRRLAQLLGGDVTVSSKLGQGSTFSLHLPHEEVSERTAHA